MLLQYARANPSKPGVTRPGFGRLSVATGSFVVSVCTAILIARQLTPGASGIYMFVLWLATAAVPAIGVGMLAVTSRHIAEIQSQAESHLAAGIFHFVWRRQYHSILFYCLIYILL